AIWQAYLAGITPLSIKDHEIVLGVPNTLIRDRVESRFLGLIQDTVTGTVGRDLVVQLEVVAPAPEPAEESLPLDVGAGGNPPPGHLPSAPWRDSSSSAPANGRSTQLGPPVLDP